MAFNVDQIKNEIMRYVSQNPMVLQAALLSDTVFLHQHAKTIRKVKGEYASVQSLVSHVVQTFYSKKFTPYGDVSFYKKYLKSYRQKVDFQFDPADVLGTVIEQEYEEKKDREKMSISVMAINWLKAKIVDDVNLLSITGVYDAASIGSDTPVFGKSMDGLNTILAKAKVATDNPVFSIPGDAITSANVLAQVTAFERSIPAYVQVGKVFMPEDMKWDYQAEYEDTFGQNKFQGDAVKTRFRKLEIVGVPNMTAGELFATSTGNLLELIDDRENPAEISDIQIDKRIINVLGEFSLGYDFALNQGVYVHTTDVAKNKGLNNTAQNKLFYPQTFQ